MDRELKNKLIKITWPILLELIFMSLLGSIDILMLSRYSDNAVAIVGVINQIIWMINLAFCVITAGTSILVAQYIGSKREESDLIQICGISIGLNTILGVILSFVMFFGGTVIFKLLNTPVELISMGNSYMKIVGGFTFTAAIMMTLIAILRSFGLTKICMKITVGMNVVNIIGNYILIYGKFGAPELGITGAAISTTVSRIIAIIVLSWYVYKVILNKAKPYMFKEFPMKHFKNIISIGIPTVGEQLSYNVTQLIITSFINTVSITSMTVKSYMGNITFLAFMFSAAVGQGASIVVGQLIGNGEKEKAYQLYKYCIRISLVVTVIASIIVAFMGEFILGIFTNNQEVIVLGGLILFVNILLEPGRTMNMIGINSIRATGDVKYPVYIAIFSMWIIAVLASYILGIKLGFGLPGIWIAFALDEWVRGLLIMKRWKSRKWETKAFVNNI